jgi:hypothetical protein
MRDLFERLETNPFIAHIGQTGYLYNTFSVLHYFCIFVMVGSMAMVDLRVLGIAAKRATISQLAGQMFPWMWTAFAIAMLSGFLEFLPSGGDFQGSHQFQMKELFIILAVVFGIIVQLGVRKWSDMPEPPVIAKVIAVLSILCWLGAMVFALNVAAIDGLG